MRIRTDIQANYKAVFTDSYKTIRMRLDNSKPILAPSTPEISDIAINSRCAANCSYCYTSATMAGKDFENIVNKAIELWDIDDNEKPFQIAIGGAGEPTMHKDFAAFVKAVKELQIVPNYTTNAMKLSDTVLKATQDYVGGAAVSWHPHIPKAFSNGMEKLKGITKLNAHVIVGEEKSFDDLKMIYEKYGDILEYIVLLPYQAAGRASEISNTEKVWKDCFDWIALQKTKNFAFGALFHPYLSGNKPQFNIDIYDPEIYSGYRIFDDSFKTLRVSSYNLNKK